MTHEPPPDAQPVHSLRLITDGNPTDGRKVLLVGRHTASPPDADGHERRGNTWWAIARWDTHRAPHRWRNDRDGSPTWTEPTHYMELPEPHEPEPPA